MEKYKNKYRIPSARLQNWDYGANAAYFVTICTTGREHYFGKITVETQFIASQSDEITVDAQFIASQSDEITVETQFIASQLGEIAQKYWR